MPPPPPPVAALPAAYAKPAPSSVNSASAQAVRRCSQAQHLLVCLCFESSLLMAALPSSCAKLIIVSSASAQSVLLQADLAHKLGIAIFYR